MFSSCFNFYKKLIFAAITIAGLFLIIASGGSGSSGGGGDDPSSGAISTLKTVEIETPKNDDEFLSGNYVTFVGKALDTNNNEINNAKFSWHSSIDKQLGTSDYIKDIDLSDGNHVITCIATYNGVATSATINIKIKNESNTAPIVKINQPTGTPTYHPRDAVILEGSASDAEDSADGTTIPNDHFVWSSSIQDSRFWPVGKRITVNLIEGTHRIDLVVRDSKDNNIFGSAQTTLIIKNDPPIAKITRPADNSSFKYGTMILFKGTATDEGSNLSPNNCEWRSSSRYLGKGLNLDIDTLPIGEHIISFIARDSYTDHLTDMDQIKVTITP